jgi:hypothetical protein
MDVSKFLEIVKLKRFDNAPKEAVYYANGLFYNKTFMWYYETHSYRAWVQSGYRSVSQLKHFPDFQEREIK